MKLKIITTGLLLLSTSAAFAQQSVVAAIINHNIKSGGQPQAAANHIVNLLEMNPQKGLVLLSEANYARQYFDLPYDGWHHIWPWNSHEARGNPIFVRDAAATMMASWRLNMQESWVHLQPKDPRVYTAVKCEMVANPWIQFHCINVHFPTNRDPEANAAARQESIDALIAESERLPNQPLIICGDFNMGANAARNQIANAIGGRLYSDANVDHIIVRDGVDVAITDVEVVRLGKFISDHVALRYNITFTEIENSSTVADWTLY